MNKWIKCNLPWSYHYFEDFPQIPEKVFKRADKRFGISLNDAREKLCPGSCWDENSVYGKADKLINAMESKLYDKVDDSSKVRDLIKEKINKSKDSNIKAYAKWREFENKYDEFLNSQPEIAEMNKQIEEMKKDINSKSFCGRGLNKAGTLIETAGGKQYLIGDINHNGGVCDDCVAFNGKTIIKRYKIVYEK